MSFLDSAVQNGPNSVEKTDNLQNFFFVTQCNETIPDIPIGGSGLDINKQNDKYKPFVINMLIMNYVHHPSIEMEGTKP